MKPQITFKESSKTFSKFKIIYTNKTKFSIIYNFYIDWKIKSVQLFLKINSFHEKRECSIIFFCVVGQQDLELLW